LICLGQDGRLVGQQGAATSLQITHVQHLKLGDHLGSSRLGPEAAALARQTRHEGGAGHDRWLLDHHRYEYLAAVHDEVDGDP
jgi:hypothetical protein